MLPDYWIERPPLSLDASVQSTIDELLSGLQAGGSTRALGCGNVPPWKFLCGIAERHRFAFHGTGDSNIESFKPRRPVYIRYQSRNRSRRR